MGEGRLHERLAESISQAILSGELSSGSVLPAHRTVAQQIGVSLGTVTRAYDVLQRRGLTRSEKGRGTFVAPRAPRRGTGFDLSVNLPPPFLTTKMLAALMNRMADTVEADLFNWYSPAAGLLEHRMALARAISRGRALQVDPDRLMITNGAQHGLFVALAATAPGPIAMEALTYPGALRAARALGRPLIALSMDEEGVRPDALRDALSAPEPPTTLYAMPSLQNPTGATMSERRRIELVQIAVENDLALVEDDVYSIFAPPDVPTLTELAPERTFHVGSLSKCFAPGLRVGHLLAPTERLEACNAWMQATQSMPNPLSALSMVQGFAEGLNDTVSSSIRADATKRSEIARGIFGNLLCPQTYDGLHVWAPMETVRARDIVLAAARRNIILAPPSAFMVDPHAEHSGLRLCLGTLPENDLASVLTEIAGILSVQNDGVLDFGPVA
ncbi:PLP-dependent aminotransferase family protein [Oceaniradius stylonematis]|uniref:aminotransferase-like domain-containing protein n=2 Tax=Alphaproteobacteria TaxID=28211 RepID=UPI00273FE397|nr:PLP-dependent aminotransferase family protein [Oceaniradius stylonematis]